MEAVKKYDPKTVKLVDVDLNEEAQAWKERQQNELIIDFDEAVAEERAEALTVKFQGADYRLPRSAPAWLPLFVGRHGEGPNNELSDKHNLEMIERLLGRDFADKILEGGNFISFDLVNDKILVPLFRHWGFQGAANKKKQTTP